MVQNLFDLSDKLAKLLTDEKENNNATEIASKIQKQFKLIPIDFKIINETVNKKLFRVFQFLREKQGFCLISGITFGIDFLMYEGSPDKCHSSHFVCVNSSTKTENEENGLCQISSYFDLVMLCRNAHQVRKRLLVCFVD